MALPADIPFEAVGFLEEMGYLRSDTLQVGDAPPCLTLSDLNTGEPIRVGDPNAPLPTVLVFGSYT